MRVTLLPTFVMLLAGCATASEESEAPASAEQLIASPPPNFSLVYQMNNIKTRISDFLPEGQSEEDWQTRLSFQSHLAEDLPFDPIALLTAESEESSNRCSFVRQFNVFSGYENNYETTVQLVLCGENDFTGKGEVRLIKAIRGEEYYYTIRLVSRIAPYEVGSPEFASEQVGLWSNYLSDIHVCDGTDEHPCH